MLDAIPLEVRRSLARLAIAIMLIGFPFAGRADDATTTAKQMSGTARLAQTQKFFELAQQPTGILIPLYSYPANIHRNAAFNAVIDLKLTYPTVPVCVILNPANGPGDPELDPNYVKAIDRLHGAGVVILGYVSTYFAQEPLDKVTKDIGLWKTRAPRVNGIFLDEMTNDDAANHLDYYIKATAIAHEAGFWPVVSNPGAPTPEPYFKRGAADVIVVHENEEFPTEEAMRGDYFGGYADYPPFTRAVLVHSYKTFDHAKFNMIRKYARWVYVTHDRFDAKADPNDPENNPWDEISQHLETMFKELSQPISNARVN